MKRFTISTVVSLTILDYAQARKPESIQQKLIELRQNHFESYSQLSTDEMGDYGTLNLAQVGSQYVYPSLS
jgi:hypothetical protein